MKIFLAICLMLLFVVSPCFASDLFYARNEASIAVAEGGTLDAGTALVTGRCFGKVLIVTGENAGDYVLIYDNTSATGTPKLDISVGTASQPVIVPLEEAEFGTGVFANSTLAAKHDALKVTFIYTQ